MNKILILLVLIATTTWISAECSHPTHPLDPTTPSEINLVRAIVRRAYPSNNSTTQYPLTFQYVGLDEPHKSTILSWQSSNSKTKTLPPRRFSVIARYKKQSLEITVDVSKRSIISSKVYEGHGYPMLTFNEQLAASELPFSYGPFEESVKKRGLNISEVVCSDFTAGWFGQAQTKRILKIECYSIKGTANLYMRPLQGIAAVVDIDEMKIIDYKDRFGIPVPKAEGTEYRASKLKPPFGPKLKGIAVMQHGGPGFKINGHSVSLLQLQRRILEEYEENNVQVSKIFYRMPVDIGPNRIR